MITEQYLEQGIIIACCLMWRAESGHLLRFAPAVEEVTGNLMVSAGSQKTDWRHCGQLLADGIADLDLTVSAKARGDLMRYLQELVQWNKTYNLTAVRDPVQMVVKHLLDSLSVLPYIGKGQIADVGSGAGLPGIPLSLVAPRNEYILIDSNGKKAAFMRHVVRRFGLKHVRVLQTRAEDYQPDLPFDTVVSRACAAVEDLVGVAGHLCGPQSRMLAMLGKVPAELPDTVAGFRLASVEALQVPGLSAERHLAILERALI